MSLSLETIQKKFEEYRNSDQYKKDLEHMSHKQKLKERNIEYLHNLSIADRMNLLYKIYTKYSSKEYKDKEMSLGYYEPRCPLYDVIMDYAIIYGKPSMYKTDPDAYFPEEQYDIDGKFVIGAINGQGTFMYMMYVKDDEVIPHEINEATVIVYDKDDNIVVTTNNICVFNDIRLQIKEKHLDGYYVVMEADETKTKYPINQYGKIIHWPNDLFNISVYQHAKLI